MTTTRGGGGEKSTIREGENFRGKGLKSCRKSAGAREEPGMPMEVDNVPGGGKPPREGGSGEMLETI